MLQDKGQNRSKMEIWKRDVDGFSSFIIDFFSYLIFLSESSLIKINVREKIKNGQSRETDNIEHKTQNENSQIKNTTQNTKPMNNTDTQTKKTPEKRG